LFLLGFQAQKKSQLAPDVLLLLCDLAYYDWYYWWVVLLALLVGLNVTSGFHISPVERDCLLLQGLVWLESSGLNYV